MAYASPMLLVAAFPSNIGPDAAHVQTHQTAATDRRTMAFFRSEPHKMRTDLRAKRTATMDEIKGIARAKIRPGKLGEYKRLCGEAMEIVRNKDTGTLQYEIFFNEDESEAVVFERYRDIDAAMEHFSNIGHLMESLMATATVTGEVLGKPSPKMQLGEGGPRSSHRGWCSRIWNR